MANLTGGLMGLQQALTGPVQQSNAVNSLMGQLQTNLAGPDDLSTLKGIDRAILVANNYGNAAKAAQLAQIRQQLMNEQGRNKRAQLAATTQQQINTQNVESRETVAAADRTSRETINTSNNAVKISEGIAERQARRSNLVTQLESADARQATQIRAQIDALDKQLAADQANLLQRLGSTEKVAEWNNNSRAQIASMNNATTIAEGTAGRLAARANLMLRLENADAQQRRGIQAQLDLLDNKIAADRESLREQLANSNDQLNTRLGWERERLGSTQAHENMMQSERFGNERENLELRIDSSELISGLDRTSRENIATFQTGARLADSMLDRQAQMERLQMQITATAGRDSTQFQNELKKLELVQTAEREMLDANLGSRESIAMMELAMAGNTTAKNVVAQLPPDRFVEDFISHVKSTKDSDLNEFFGTDLWARTEDKQRLRSAATMAYNTLREQSNDISMEKAFSIGAWRALGIPNGKVAKSNDGMDIMFTYDRGWVPVASND